MSCPHCVTLQEKYPGARLRECRHEARDLDSNTPLHVPKQAPTGARVFIHPRCLSGPASGALTAVLQEHGFDLDKISVGPVDKRGHAELVRLHPPEANGTLNLERMDGMRFTYHPLSPFPPSAA